MVLNGLVRRALSFLSSRRAHARRRTEVPVDWRLFGSSVHARGAFLDLSRGGAFIPTADPKPEGSPLVLALGALELHARVAWSGPHGMGVRFTRTLPRDAMV
jgi:hypothetical protein